MEFNLPTWEDIPDFGIYISQIETIINNLTYSGDGITKNMVNNYVKHKYITKPEKKKYSRKQVARLIMLTYLKKVLSLEDSLIFIEALEKDYGDQEAYRLFQQALARGESKDKENGLIEDLAKALIYKTRLEINLGKEGGYEDGKLLENGRQL